MNRPVFVAQLALALVVAIPASARATTPGEGFDVERYAVVLRPDLSTGAVSGTETIVLRSTSSGLTRLAFSTNALRIDQATLNGAPIAVAASPDGIVFDLPRALRKGERASLGFRLAGTPARGVTQAAGGLYTGYFACDWMVCLQDAPGDKADFALDLFLPAGMSALGVGRAAPEVLQPEGLVLHRWRSTRAYSPYLYAFAAGPFARRSVRAGRNDLVYLDATGGQADLVERFAQTAAMIAFFEGEAGLPLPDHRYTQILVPGREAQEAAGFSLIGVAELDREQGDAASAWVIAHELAHQWWGNLVTCATWRDFWLNEGLATFMTAAWKERSLGRAAYDQELDAARRRVERVRELGFDKPLAWDGKYPSLGARRAIQYSKGALFLAHLRETMGDEAFWKGLWAFTRRGAGGVVTSRDFQGAMQAESPRDLAPVFAEWVYGR